MKKYKEGYKLKEDEYLLKVREGEPNTGFMTKYNKNGSMPVAFKDWGEDYTYKEVDGKYIPVYSEPLKIRIIKETFRSGWKFDGFRIGKSMSWVSLIHPEGFTVEIYLQQFDWLIKDNDFINGEIIGEFKWEYSKLIKK